MSAHVHNLFLEVKCDLQAASNSEQLKPYNIQIERLNKIKPYTVFGFDLYQVGWLKSDFGGWLGIPEHLGHCDGEFQTYGIMVCKRQSFGCCIM